MHVFGAKKKKFNWGKNLKKLNSFVKKNKKKNNYDCIVPVSGGKNSSFVLIELEQTQTQLPCCNY